MSEFEQIGKKKEKKKKMVTLWIAMTKNDNS
jgi:hypothetical protein